MEVVMKRLYGLLMFLFSIKKLPKNSPKKSNLSKDSEL